MTNSVKNIDESYNDSDEESGELLFYTPKIVQQLDDKDIIEEIFIRYPLLMEANKNKEEKEERKIFISFIQEKEIVNFILEKYNISIIDLVKLFYRHFSYIFNTISYANKVKAIIETNGYPTEIKN